MLDQPSSLAATFNRAPISVYSPRTASKPRSSTPRRADVPPTPHKDLDALVDRDALPRRSRLHESHRRRIRPLTHPLDSKNELYISTYPAWFPRETKSIPFLYKALRTPDSVYFEVFVREIGTTGGKNPNVDSIRIHSFSYGFPGQDSVAALTDYPSKFWQQGDPKNDARTRKAVMHSEGWYLRLKMHMTLNGQEHRIDEVIHANTRTIYRPLILEVLR
jgi:hypothetical protein